MRALVFGSTTLLGRRIVPQIEGNGYDTYTYSGKEELSFVLNRLGQRFDIVFNCLHDDTGDVNAYFQNLMTDTAIFQWAIATRQHRMVYLSHADVYPEAYKGAIPLALGEAMAQFDAASLHPANNNGWVKMTGELSAQGAIAAGVKVHIVRLFDYYGPDLPNTHVFSKIKQTAKDLADPHKDEIFRRDWMHIDDVVAAIFKVVAEDYPGPINICSGQVTSVVQLYRLLVARFHPRYEIADAFLNIPRKANLIGNADKLLELGFEPRMLRAGIQDVTRWG